MRDHTLGNRPCPRLTRNTKRLVRRLQRRAPALPVPVKIVALGKPGAIQPRDRVADLKARVLQAAHKAVEGASAAEREQMTARPQNAQRLASPSLMPTLHARGARPIPLLT